MKTQIKHHALAALLFAAAFVPAAANATAASNEESPAHAGLDAGAPVPSAWVPPKLLHFEEAPYPPEDEAKGVEGDVVMRLSIDASGGVSAIEVLSSQDPLMQSSAEATARKFRFVPAMNGSSPETSVVRYTFRFRLEGQVAEVKPVAPSSLAVAALPATVAAPPNAASETALEANVSAQRPTSAASADSVYDQDLQQRIIRTPADLLHSVPGLFTAQHQGGGKADQYFLRGFDADHGTDIAFNMDGVPINLPSNGHGQGYTDVHFVLPETIDRLEFSKGPYFADKGDFDTAGAVDLHTRRDFAEDEVQGMYGQFNTYRVFGVGTTGTGPNSGWIAGEVYGLAGPYDNSEGLQRYSTTARQNLQLSAHTTLSLEAVAYASQWSASGLIPPRAVADGEIDRFGSIDPNEGGQTQRQMFIATVKSTPSTNEELSLTAYAVHFQMRLWNDFTFFLTDPINGDLVEQNDSRVYTGLNARYQKRLRWGEATFTTTLGLSGRFDSMNVSLYHDNSERQHLPSCYGMPLFCDNADIGQSNESAFLEESARLSSWLHVTAGVRGDLFTWNVVDQRAQPLPGAAPTTGTLSKSLASPKLAIVISPLSQWDLFLDAGGGFHSNDARGIIAASGAGALARAWGSEIGSRVTVADRLVLSAALWFLYLESETVFDPDIDTTASNPATRRYGFDLSARVDLFRHWLFADADLTLAHPRYVAPVDGGTYVALAPTETLTAGISAVLPWGLHARLAMREIADHPASTDGKEIAQGYTLFDFTASYRWRFLELGVSVENLFNTPWQEGQFDYVSRLPGEPPGGVEQVDYTPGAPRNVQATLTVYF